MEPPPGFSDRLMDRIKTMGTINPSRRLPEKTFNKSHEIQEANAIENGCFGQFGHGGQKSHVAHANRQTGCFALKQALINLFGLPQSRNELSAAFLSMGVFFLVACFAFLLGLDSPLPWKGTASGIYALFGPAILAGFGLVIMGWMGMRNHDSLIRTRKPLASVALLFGLSLVFGFVLTEPPDLAIGSFCFGFSGLITTVFLMIARRRFCCPSLS